MADRTHYEDGFPPETKQKGEHSKTAVVNTPLTEKDIYPTEVTGQQIQYEASKIDEKPIDVKANPSGSATQVLAKLLVNDTIYSIPNVEGASAGTISVFLGLDSGGKVCKASVTTLPTFPEVTAEKTYVLKLVSGTLSWVEEVGE